LLRSPKFNEGYNCAKASSEIAQDLKRKGFEVKRNFTVGTEGTHQQYYAEVLDPESNQWIQLDATPWFQQMGTIHEKTREVNVENGCISDALMLHYAASNFVVTKKLADESFVDIYMAGGYFSTAQHLEHVRKALAAQEAGKEMQFHDNPHYHFILQARQVFPFDGKTIALIEMDYEILDSSKLLGNAGSIYRPCSPSIDSYTRLEDLVQKGAARVDFLIDTGKHEPIMIENTSLLLLKGLETMDAYAETTLWLQENLGILSNIVSKIGPRLLTVDDNVLTMGQPCARVCSTHFTNFAESKRSPFDGLIGKDFKQPYPFKLIEFK